MCFHVLGKILLFGKRRRTYLTFVYLRINTMFAIKMSSEIGIIRIRHVTPLYGAFVRSNTGMIAHMGLHLRDPAECLATDVAFVGSLPRVSIQMLHHIRFRSKLLRAVFACKVPHIQVSLPVNAQTAWGSEHLVANVTDVVGFLSRMLMSHVCGECLAIQQELLADVTLGLTQTFLTR